MPWYRCLRQWRSQGINTMMCTVKSKKKWLRKCIKMGEISKNLCVILIISRKKLLAMPLASYSYS